MAFEGLAREFCQQRSLTFVRLVGAGAFKETFEIRDAEGAPRALKIIGASNSSERLQREVAALQTCRHEGIGRLYGIELVGTDGHVVVTFVEEFLGGGSLTEELRPGVLSRERVVELGSDLIAAVAEIASHELIHRDIKPDNILFRDGSRAPVLVDFGLVRDLAAVSLTQSWADRGPGTPYFAPPEQLRNEKHLQDWRADQFALGVVLSLCAIGVHPYGGDGIPPSEVVERVVRRETPSGKVMAQLCDLGLPQVVQMVAPWPISRYRTPELLASAWEETRT